MRSLLIVWIFISYGSAIQSLAADAVINPQELESVFKQLEPAVGNQCILPEPSKLVPTLKTLESADFTSCVEELCGKPEVRAENSPTSSENMEAEATRLRPEIEKRFRPVLEKWFNASLVNERKSIKRIRNLLGSAPPQKRIIQNFINFSLMSKAMSAINLKMDESKMNQAIEEKKKAGAFELSQFDIVPYIDDQKTIAGLVANGLTSAEASATLDYFKKALISTQREVFSNLENGGDDHPESVLLANGDGSFRETVLKQVKELEEKTNQFVIEFQNLFEIQLPESLFQSMKDATVLTRSAVDSSSGFPLYFLNHLIEENMGADKGMKLFKDALSGQTIPRSFDPVQTSWITRFKVRENFERQAKILESDLEAKKRIDNILEYCLTTLSQTAASYLPKKNYLKITGEIRSNLGNQFDNAIGKWLSTESSANWQKQSGKLEFVFPPSRDDWFKLVQADFNSSSQSEMLNSGEEILKKEPELVWLEVADFAKIGVKSKEEVVENLNNGKVDDQILFHDIYQKCMYHRIEPAMRDHHLKKSSTIITSWSTLKESQSTLGVALHERGHSLDGFLSSKSVSVESLQKYNSLAACLDARHVENPLRDQSTQYGAIPFYQGEDFADWVSGHLASDPVAFGCELVQLDEKGKYASSTGNDEKPWTLPRIINLKQSDQHSSGVFRTLHFYWIKNKKFPQACLSALEQAHYPTDWGRCELN